MGSLERFQSTLKYRQGRGMRLRDPERLRNPQPLWYGSFRRHQTAPARYARPRVEPIQVSTTPSCRLGAVGRLHPRDEDRGIGEGLAKRHSVIVLGYGILRAAGLEGHAVHAPG